jgi:hypothetical protein
LNQRIGNVIAIVDTPGEVAIAIDRHTHLRPSLACDLRIPSRAMHARSVANLTGGTDLTVTV